MRANLLTRSDRPRYRTARRFVTRRYRPRFELLETRRMLAALPIISEFLASNQDAVLDGDGAASDFVEIYNAGDAAIDLAGYHLTDDAGMLDKWTFPSVDLEVGHFLIVFASSPDDGMGGARNDYVDGGGYPHTNFSLNAEGEYLALVEPDGVTVVSEYGAGGADYPPQREDISYGIGQQLSTTTLIAADANAKVLIPTVSSELASDWNDPSFGEAGWSDATASIGFDAESPAATVSTNIALGRPTTQSSRHPCCSINGAEGVDGVFGPNFTHTLNTDPSPTWQVELAETSSIDSIVLHNRDGGCGPVCLQRLRDITVTVLDANLLPVFTSELLNPGNVLLNPLTLSLDFAPGVSGKYLRVTRTPEQPGAASDDANVLSLTEVEVFSEQIVTDTGNLAANKPATQSSKRGSFTANLAVDGVFGNFTHTSGAEDPATWQVDLLSTAAISRIVLYNRGGGCCQSRLRDVFVEILHADGTTVEWTSPLLNPENVLGGGGVGGPPVIDIDVEALAGGRVAGQIVRVSRIADPDLSGSGGQGNDDEDGVLSLGEVEVFGELVPRYAPFIRTDLLSEMSDVNASAFLRIPFDVSDPASLNALTLWVRYDDGFNAYLNGVPIAARNAPAGPMWNSHAEAERADEDAVIWERINVSQYLNLLNPTGNVLAIQGLNVASDDDDFLLGVELVGTDIVARETGYMLTPSAGQPNGDVFFGFVDDTSFSVDRGFYEASDLSAGGVLANGVSITSSTPGATIVYTTDGSAPAPGQGTEVPAANVDSPPTAVVPITTTTAVRAMAYKEGFLSTNVDTHTYLFLDDVLGQTGSGFPATWSGGFPADYAMDPNVVNDPLYRNAIKDDLRAIPTMSIVMDVDDWFDSSRGIYANSEARGSAWERAASIELIDTDGDTLFQEDAGVRLFGFGFRPHPNTPKHSFRLLFKEQYGSPKLDFPLFGEGTVDKLDNIILRGQGNASYGDFRPGSRQYTQYLQDAWARQTQAAMGDPTTGTTFVHLYLNGLYWGLYNPTERPDGKFMEERFGGTEDDYDALNARVGNIEVQSGDTQAWDQLINIVSTQDVTQSAVYSQVRSLLDIDNFIDYLLINFYGGNKDWPGSNGNNLRVARKRDGSMGFLSFVWDVEWMFEEPNFDATGLTTAAPTHGLIHSRLISNVEYRQRFNDLVQEHFFNDGALTPARVAERYLALANQIDRAIVGESARWGDVRREPPYTRDLNADNWIQVRDRLLNDYFPQRAQTVLAQMRARGWLLNVPAPEFLVDGQPRHGGQVNPGDEFSISPAAAPVWFTLDGSDPRLPGGLINNPDNGGTAMLYTGEFPLTETANVRARALNGGSWSALSEATFYVNAAGPGNLRINEIMYHPPDAAPAELALDPSFDGGAAEYIELTNTSALQAIDLTGVTISAGIDFTFGATTLPPGESTLVVRDLPAFELRYGSGRNIAGQFASGSLSNGGERLHLSTAAGGTIQDFSYDDEGNWPGRADGGGASLEVIDTEGDYNDGKNWRSSTQYNGSPGEPPLGALIDVVVNEVLSHTDPPQLDALELFNATDSPIDIGGWYLSDSSDNYRKYAIPPGTTIAAGGYLVFDESDFNPTPLDPGPNDFAFSGGHGDDVWLMAADASGRPTRFVDHVEFDAQSNGQSWGRWPNAVGDLYPMTPLTLGNPNSGPRVGPLVISELMYNPPDPDGAGPVDPDDLEFVEVHNPTSDPVALQNWTLSGGIAFSFADETVIPAGGTFVVVGFDPSDPVNGPLLNNFRQVYGIDAGVTLVGGFSGRMDNGGERIQLRRPDEPPLDEPGFYPALLEDEVRYGDQDPWPLAADAGGDSLTRVNQASWGNDPASWIAAPPTPGAESFAGLTVLSVRVNAAMTDPLDRPGGPQPTSWRQQRSDLRVLEVVFNRPIREVGPADLQLTNLGVNAPLDADMVIPLTTNHLATDANVLRLTFAHQELPDGVYRLIVFSSVQDSEGQSLEGDYTITGNPTNRVYKLTAEWNGDGGVTIFDFPTFAYWFGQSVPTAPEYMDLEADGGVTIFDFPVFARVFGSGVTFPTTAGQGFVAAPPQTPTRERPRRRDEFIPFPEHPLERQLAVATGFIVEFRARDGEAKVLNTGHGLPDLEQVLDQIGADVLSAWSQKTRNFKTGASASDRMQFRAYPKT